MTSIALIIAGGGLINSLVELVVAVIVIALLYWLISLIPLPAPAPQIIRVIFIIVLVLIVLGTLLQGFGIWGGGGGVYVH